MLPKKSKRAKSFRQRAKDLLADFGAQSSIHGVSYITESGRSRFETVWWITVFCLSFCCCGKLIYDAWNINPIIISFEETPTPIWQIPFPAITICPRSFARSDRINITKFIELQNNGVNHFARLSHDEKIQTLAKSVMSYGVESLNNIIYFTDCNKCLEKMREIKIPLEEIFIQCKFRDRVINCTEAFQETIVGYHLCYTFNDLGFYRQLNQSHITDEEVIDYWNIEEGYKPNASIGAFPYRALGAGPKFGLSVLLQSSNLNFDKVCSIEEAYWLEYRMPKESPQFEMKFYEIPKAKSVNVIVTPTMLKTYEDLHHYSPTKRNCYFSNERQLKYFKQYTQSNCELECQVEMTLQTCGCVPIFIEGLEEVDICGPALMACHVGSRKSLFLQNFMQCHCLPGCSSISFDSEVAMTDLNSHEYTEINIFFSKNKFLAVKRTELYGNIDFLANCGGLLGLCLGFSVLSLLEIVYFCSIRLWFDWQGNDIRDITAPIRKADVQAAPSTQVFKISKDLLIDYCSRTTIQGIKYVFDTTLTVIERVCWLIVVGISIFCCGSLISVTFRQYDESPVTITYANEETPISKIPFPAVTICPKIGIDDLPGIFHYFKVRNLSLYDLTEENVKVSTVIAQVCDSGMFNDIDPKNKTDCQHCPAYMKHFLGSMNRRFYRCQDMYRTATCSEMFEEVITEEGVCYVYNSLNVFRNQRSTLNDDSLIDEWTLEGGYINYIRMSQLHPRPGSKSVLLVVMRTNLQQVDTICQGPIIGAKVYLHLPNEVPQMKKHFHLMPYRHYTQIMIDPKMTTTGPELRDIPVGKRQCYFSDERNLRFFRNYTQNNCEIECLANETLTRCGCLMFFMPKTPGVKYCGISPLECYQTAIQLIAGANMNTSRASGCKCLPTCTSIAYETEINHFKSDILDKTVFEIGFRVNQFVALRRSQLFGKTDFLASCGGLLGLFLGFSMISLVELIYFCTVRLVCSFKMR